MTLVAGGRGLVVDAGAIVPARVEGIAGRTGDVAIDTHPIGVVAGEHDERGFHGSWNGG